MPALRALDLVLQAFGQSLDFSSRASLFLSLDCLLPDDLVVSLIERSTASLIIRSRVSVFSVRSFSNGRDSCSIFMEFPLLLLELVVLADGALVVLSPVGRLAEGRDIPVDLLGLGAELEHPGGELLLAALRFVVPVPAFAGLGDLRRYLGEPLGQDCYVRLDLGEPGGLQRPLLALRRLRRQDLPQRVRLDEPVPAGIPGQLRLIAGPLGVRLQVVQAAELAEQPLALALRRLRELRGRLRRPLRHERGAQEQ